MNKTNGNSQINRKPVVLITGCGTGIGFSLAKLFYSLPHFITIATARSRHLDSLKSKLPENSNFSVHELDVTKESKRKELIQFIGSQYGGVDILINNAGISFRSSLEDMSSSEEVLQMNVNYFGPIGLIKECLPYMRSVGRGKIICISSVSGMLSMPTMASYSASKRALEGACEALWYETRPFGIDISLIQPGFVKSDSFKNVYYSERAREQIKTSGPYSDFYNSMTPFVERLMSLSLTTPDKIANLVYQVIHTRRPPLWISATLDAQIFYYLRRLMPRRLLLPILYYLLPNSLTWAKKYSNKRDP